MLDLFKQSSIYLNNKQKQLLEHFIDIFLDKNQYLNLSAIRNPKDMILKHLIDSLMITKYLNLSGSLIDIGSGGGIPAIPLAIYYPDLEITCCDSTTKKIRAVTEMSKQLKLKNLHPLTDRAEKIGQEKTYREKYNFATARAVAELPTLLEYLTPLVKIGGQIIAYKGLNYHTELQKASSATKKLGLKYKEVHSFYLPQNQGGRSLLIWDKITSTPSNYPRKIGLPLKNPL